MSETPEVDCPCCGQPTDPEDMRTVGDLAFCFWCIENGCNVNAAIDFTEPSESGDAQRKEQA